MMNAIWFAIVTELLWPHIHISGPYHATVEVKEALDAIFIFPGRELLYSTHVDETERLLVMVGNRRGVEKAVCLCSSRPCGPVEQPDPAIGVISLRYANAGSIADLLNRSVARLGKFGPMDIFGDVATNSLVVQASPADLDALKTVVEGLDQEAFY